MFLSVIIPVYNAEKYLNDCIDSVLSQNFADFELILINDGSTDSSGDICEKYVLSDNRIKAIHQKNDGVSSARNNGLKHASGKYVCFIDADDYILPGYFESIYKAFSEKSYNIVMHYKNAGNYVFNGYKDFIKSKFYFNITPFYVFDRIFLQENDILFPTGITHSEDHAFLIKSIVSSSTIKVIDNSYYVIRYNRESATRRQLTHKASDSHIEALLDIIKYCNKKSIDDAFLYKRVMQGTFHYFILLLKIRRKNFSYNHAKRSFIDFLLKAAEIKPDAVRNSQIFIAKHLFFILFPYYVFKRIKNHNKL